MNFSLKNISSSPIQYKVQILHKTDDDASFLEVSPQYAMLKSGTKQEFQLGLLDHEAHNDVLLAYVKFHFRKGNQ